MSAMFPSELLEFPMDWLTRGMPHSGLTPTGAERAFDERPERMAGSCFCSCIKQGRDKLLQLSLAREEELHGPGGRRDCTRCSWAPADRAAQGLQSASLRIHRVPQLS